MEYFELLIKSSLQVIQANEEGLTPDFYGSGCLVNYQGRQYFLSVSHVTNIRGTITSIESCQSPVNNQTPIYPIGGLHYFSEFIFPNKSDQEQFSTDLEKGGQSLDITFAEVKQSIELLQPTVDLGFYKVEKGEKVCLNLEEASDPTNNEEYGFYGNIKHTYTGKYLRRTPTLKVGLRYHRTSGPFHIFLASQIIRDENEYKGCSGAPILDTEGRLIALACQVRTNTKMIYGFSILECKRLIDQTLIIEDIDQNANTQ